MSIYGKFFVEFDHPDWTFAVDLGANKYSTDTQAYALSTSFTVTSGTNVTILDVLSRIKAGMSTALDAVPNSYETAGASVGPGGLTMTWLEGPSTNETTTTRTFANSTVTLGAAGYYDYLGLSSASLDGYFFFEEIVWSTCSDDLLDVLGFDQTETPVGTPASGGSKVIHANNLPRYCWFPGVATYGGTGGVGITSDTGWVPVDAHSRVVSGAGNMRITGPSRLQYTRRIRFEAMKRSEVLDSRHNGPIAFFDQWATKTFRWYPDRDVGTVTTAGTQGDPGPSSYHTDDDCDYWLCKLASEPRITQGSDPDWFTVTLDLNGEPV